MDVIEAIATRRSIGRVTGDVSESEVRTLVELALCAPNHRLTAPWRFTVLRGDARVRLGARWAELLAPEAPRGVDRDAYLLKEARKPTRAPVLLVSSTRTDSDPTVASEDFAATAAATQNILLAAHARGLGAVWRTGAMAYRAEINAFLGLDARDRIVAFVYLGSPAMDPPAPRLRDVAKFLYEIL